jgi:hypothetical protein
MTADQESSETHDLFVDGISLHSQVLVNAQIAEVDFGAGNFTGFATYQALLPSCQLIGRGDKRRSEELVRQF